MTSGFPFSTAVPGDGNEHQRKATSVKSLSWGKVGIIAWIKCGNVRAISVAALKMASITEILQLFEQRDDVGPLQNSVPQEGLSHRALYDAPMRERLQALGV